jgi:RNA polymerase-associated protein CTR9
MSAVWLDSGTQNLSAQNDGPWQVLAEQGFQAEAKTIFQRVRESTMELPDAWVNLAHMFLAEKEYFQAISLYQNCLKKFSAGTDSQVLSPTHLPQ